MSYQPSLERPRSKSLGALGGLEYGMKHIQLRPAHEHHTNNEQSTKSHGFHEDHGIQHQDEEDTTYLLDPPSPVYQISPTNPFSTSQESSIYNPEPNEWSNTSHENNNTTTTNNNHPSCLPISTTSYTPFSYQLALTNHLPLSFLQTNPHAPLFIHSTLQLPSLLSTLLSIPIPLLIPLLTSVDLLSYTTTVDPETLLPSLTPSFTSDTVHGLCIFGMDDEKAGLVGKRYGQDCQKRKVDVEVRSSEGDVVVCKAWAWVDGREDGCNEYWDLESYVAGRVVGLAGLKW